MIEKGKLKTVDYIVPFLLYLSKGEEGEIPLNPPYSIRMQSSFSWRYFLISPTL